MACSHQTPSYRNPLCYYHHHHQTQGTDSAPIRPPWRRKEDTVKGPGCLPNSSSVTVNVDDVEVGHGGIARCLARLVLKLVQVAALGERVHSQHLHTDTTAQSVTHQNISTWERVHRHHSTVSDTSEHLNMGEGPQTPQHSQ